MTSNTFDYYEALELTATAAPQELKAAYLRLVREFTPESNPERFRLVSEAYRTLSNPDKRREYDTQERLPEDVLERASELVDRIVESEDQHAIDALYRLCDEYADSRDLRFGLGVALDRIERNDEAGRVFSWLFEIDPGNSTYATWLGDSLLKSGRTSEGVQKLKEAIVLDRDNSDAYLCLAGHHTENDQDEIALKVLERGIHADGVVDVQDLPLFIRRILILARNSRWEDLESTAGDLRNAIPDSDPDAGRYAASQLAPIADIFVKAERPDLVHFTVELMQHFDSSNSELKEMADGLRDGALFYRGRVALYKDESVPAWIKALAAFWSGDEVPDDVDQFCANVDAILGARPKGAIAEWDQCKRRHSDALSPLSDRWAEVSGPLSKAAQSSTSGSGSENSGCGLLFLISGAGWLISKTLL